MVMTSRRGSEAKRSSSSRLERRIGRADHVLIEVDVRAGHEPRFVGCEKGAGARDLLGIEQATEGPALDRLLEPTVLGAVIGLHDPVLARRRHPADVEAV